VRVAPADDGVVDETLDPRESQPVGGVADEPGSDAAAAQRLVDVKLPDVGPAREAGQRPARREVGLDLVHADGAPVEQRREARRVAAERPPQRHPVDGRRAAVRQVGDVRGEHHLDPFARSEPRAIERTRDVRPDVGNAVDRRRRE